jgi:hypothetical protein
MPKSPYEGGKQRRHFTLSDQAYDHLTTIAVEANLSRSEAVERLIRSTSSWEGGFTLSDEAWSCMRDYSVLSSPLSASSEP